jgi:hypothetical protein
MIFQIWYFCFQSKILLGTSPVGNSNHTGRGETERIGFDSPLKFSGIIPTPL